MISLLLSLSTSASVSLQLQLQLQLLEPTHLDLVHDCRGRRLLAFAAQEQVFLVDNVISVVEESRSRVVDYAAADKVSHVAEDVVGGVRAEACDQVAREGLRENKRVHPGVKVTERVDRRGR